MPNLTIENKSLRDRNRELEEKLSAAESEKSQVVEEYKKSHPYDNLPEELDGRHRMVTIHYGRVSNGVNAQGIPTTGLIEETLPLQEAFDKLVSHYSFFAKPSDRNCPKECTNSDGEVVKCNNTACYIKKEFRDAMSRTKNISLKKEVPLWLAVDDIVQKGQEVELISIKEWEDFVDDEIKKEVKTSREYYEKKRKQLLETME